MNQTTQEERLRKYKTWVQYCKDNGEKFAQYNCSYCTAVVETLATEGEVTTSFTTCPYCDGLMFKAVRGTNVAVLPAQSPHKAPTPAPEQKPTASTDITISVPASLSVKSRELVAQTAIALAERLTAAAARRTERGKGADDWLEYHWKHDCMKDFRTNLESGDTIDCLVYLAFMMWHGWSVK